MSTYLTVGGGYVHMADLCPHDLWWGYVPILDLQWGVMSPWLTSDGGYVPILDLQWG